MLCLSGCVHVYDSYSWTKTREVQSVRIRMVQDISGCPFGSGGCAVLRGGECAIYVPDNTPALIGHEAVHCFGWVH